MYSDIAAHLEMLDLIKSPARRQALLALMLAAARAGLEFRARQIDDVRELLFRDAEGRQPFALVIWPDTLVFCVRRPLLETQPALAAELLGCFVGQLEGDRQSQSEIRIRLSTLVEVEELMRLLRLKPRPVNLGYEARKSG